MRRQPPALWIGVAGLAAGAVMWVLGSSWAWIPPSLFVGVCLMAPFVPRWGLFLPVLSHGPRSRNEVVLTFDDGPDPDTTPKLLELLDREGTKACFFVVGERVRQAPQLLLDIVSRGHEVGNHSDSHDPMLMLRRSGRLEREIDACQKTLAKQGVRSLVFRPPAGIVNPKLGPLLEQRGMSCVLFSVRPKDFGNRRIHDLARRVLSRARPGDIILLHDRKPAPPLGVDKWLEEVARIIQDLKGRGVNPVSLSSMLGFSVTERIADGPDSDASQE